MSADGSGQVRLTSTVSNNYEPAFSPDGSRIAFSSSRDGNFEIYLMNADGSGQTRLTYDSANDFQPAFSPDGTRIAFSSFRDGNPEIYLMNADGSGQINLTHHAAHDTDPAFSPDGTRIAFTSTRTGNPEIYTMRADGGDPIALSLHPGIDTKPSFPLGAGPRRSLVGPAGSDGGHNPPFPSLKLAGIIAPLDSATRTLRYPVAFRALTPATLSIEPLQGPSNWVGVLVQADQIERMYRDNGLRQTATEIVGVGPGALIPAPVEHLLVYFDAYTGALASVLAGKRSAATPATRATGERLRVEGPFEVVWDAGSGRRHKQVPAVVLGEKGEVVEVMGE